MATNNQNDLALSVEKVTERKVYRRPELSELGSFAKLTRDASGGPYADGSNMTAMTAM
jgi:hypothetical protein